MDIPSKENILWAPNKKQATALSSPIWELFYGGARFGGKALSLDTLIPTPDGWTTMGEVSIGDQVIDEKGKPCNVVWTSDLIEEPTYKMIFSDGTEIIAGENHQWVTSTLLERSRKIKCSDSFREKRRANRPTRVSGNKSEKFTAGIVARNKENIRVKNLQLSGVRTTGEIFNSLLYSGKLNHSVDISLPLDLPERSLIIDPYTLGAWLGDGTSLAGSITCLDEEILHQVSNGGYEVTNRSDPKNFGIKGLLVQLRTIGVLGNKHIPITYLRGSYTQRLALLQGLMDTDGYVCSSGQCEITLTNRQLSHDTHELILSLGAKATIRESEAKLNGRYVSKRYRIKFSLPDNAFRLPRKLIMQKRGVNRSYRRQIVDVRPVDRVPLRCIQVDSPSHQYLCSRHMIPTHNSDFLLIDFLDGIERGENHRGILFRKTYSELEELTFRSRQLYPVVGGHFSETKRTWTFGSGSELKLRFLERDPDVHHYQGHAYCVGVGTDILIPGGQSKKIEDIKKGDQVMTLEGPKRVIETINPYKTRCVKLSNRFGDQIHPIDHPILTVSGWQSYASILGTYSIRSANSLREFLRLPAVHVDSRLHKRNFHQDQLFVEPTRYCFHDILRVLCLQLNQATCSFLTGLQHVLEHARLFLHYISSPFFSGVPSCGHAGYGIVQDFPDCCSLCSSLYDVLSLSQKETAQDGIPSPGGVAKPYLGGCNKDAQGNIPVSIRQGSFETYEHPYSGQERKASEESFFVPSVLSPFGDFYVCDLTVQDANHYISKQSQVVNKNTWIGFDELTNWASEYCYIYMHSCARSAYGFPVRVRASGNPGSVGHGWVKSRFVDVSPPMVPYTDPHTGLKRVFIPSTLDDNPCAAKDPDYERRLKSLPEHLYRAHRFGDWSVFVGQAFQVDPGSIISPLPIPEHAPIYFTFDWGFGAPFSCGWWWSDADSNLYRFAEWYGWTGKSNEGLRLTDTEIAQQIVKSQESMGISNRRIFGLAGPDCFQRKPDYRGGGQGPSTAEVFGQHGVYLSPGDANRVHKIKQFRERLLVQRDETGKVLSGPRMFIYNNCDQFLRTIPTLTVDPNHPEDIDTRGEDHCLFGSTQVMTDSGPVRIDSLVGKEGFLFTAGGSLTKFSGCKKTRESADLYKVSFQSGRSLIATDDHKILKSDGEWIKINSLQDETCHDMINLIKHQSWEVLQWKSQELTKQLLSSMERDIGCVGFISSIEDRDYIELFGNTITGRYPKGTIYTTKMETSQTTIYLTSSSMLVDPMLPTMVSSEIGSPGRRHKEKVPRFGMGHQMVLNGTRDTMSYIARMPCIEEKKNGVKGAVQHLKDCHSKCFVQGIANSVPGNSRTIINTVYAQSVVRNFSVADQLVQSLVHQNKHGKREDKVKSVEYFGKHPVYCLDADLTHGFSVNGGLVVHNCYDEACHICMARPIGLQETTVKVNNPFEERLKQLENPVKDDIEEYLAWHHNKVWNRLEAELEPRRHDGGYHYDV